MKQRRPFLSRRATIRHSPSDMPFCIAALPWLWWGIGAREDRSLFDRIFDGNITAFSGLDANVGWQPVDEGYKRIVNHEKWVIPWLE